MTPPPPVRPIIVGADIGSYATARAFHEAFGVRTVIVARTAIGAVRHSRIVDLRVHPDLGETFVPTLRSIVAEGEGPALLLGSVDWWVRELVRHRAELAPAVVPYPDAATVERVMNKAEFARLCTHLGIPHPRTLTVRAGQPLPPDLPSPMVVKAADAGAFHAVDFPAKRKVEFFRAPSELAAYLAKAGAAGFTGEFVVQEFIPGGDDAMAAVNAFYGADGAPRLFVYGRVLLEEHTPNGLGNSVAQITGSAPDHPALAHARRLLDHVGWQGFANFDLKIRGEEHLFFELNPRVGRSGYAVTAAGYNVARSYAEAFLTPTPAPPEPVIAPPEHLFTVVPLRLLRSYAPDWAGDIARLRREGQVTNPYYYRAERHPKRWGYVAAAMANQFRKFARHHPSRRGH